MHVRRMRVMRVVARAGTITREKFRVSARAEISAQLAQTGLKLLSYNRTRYFNRISFPGQPG